ncbi:MAG TPA: serine hydrolase [Alphaproteobacteria bacterium]|nr:serine hydrolase [Alphaproteobacteria bacterium]
MRTKTGHIHPLSARVGARIERFSALVLCAFLATAFFFAQPALAIDASIVVDANSDKVISQMNPDRLLHPASMSKLMTLYLTFEALESGRLSLQRNLSVSEHAQSMSPTKLNLVAGQSIRVEDAILSLVTLSANDSAVVLAEGLGGSEDRFGQLMTRKAHQLGMVNTNFRNSNGLPDPAQISTARDMAILCRALIKRFPQYYHYFSVREFTYNGIPHANHNHLMSRYEGMDGLKTGLTNASGFNLAASAVRGGRRLIGVVFGGISAVQRDDYMAGLLDDGFQKAGGIAMTTAAPPPVPVHKPADLSASGSSQPPAATAMATAKPIAQVDPGAGPTNAAGIANSVDTTPIPQPTATTRTASGVRIGAKRPTTIGALAAISGQGDAEDGADIAPPPRSKRVHKTPPQKLAMATPTKPTAAARSSKSAKAEPAGWSIQVGAYATRQATEQAIKQAIKRAPDALKHATPVVTPLQQKHGTLYRARLAGLEAGEAKKACKAIAHCITVAPGA